jgi:hypothetical protein
MARLLLIAYTTYIRDARVKRHAEALVARGDTVDVICLAPDQAANFNGVNLLALAMPRYRGSVKTGYMRTYLTFFLRASLLTARLSLKHRYDLVIVCTMPDAAVLTAMVPRLLGSKVLLDIHDTMPELYLEKFGDQGGAWGAKLLRVEECASAIHSRWSATVRLHAGWTSKRRSKRFACLSSGCRRFDYGSSGSGTTNRKLKR